MAITCPKCGAEFDVTLFEFEHRVRCACGADIHYPGADLRSGHIAADQTGHRMSKGGDLTDSKSEIDGPPDGPSADNG